NTAVRQTTGDVLLFLNNDTRTQGPWLTALVSPLFGASSTAHDDPPGLPPPPTLMTGVRRRREPELPRSLPRDAGSLLLEGWCFAVRRETFLELGGFDERLRLYYSDTDFQCRLLQRGGSTDVL